jgi:hypothetical protein
MNFEEMAKKYPQLNVILEQLNELNKKDDLADEKAEKLREKAKEEREDADKRAKAMEKEADDWIGEKATRVTIRDLLNGNMMLMCAALSEKDAEIEELKNAFKSDLESIGKASDFEGAVDTVTELMCKYEPAPDEEEEAEIPTLDEEVPA